MEEKKHNYDYSMNIKLEYPYNDEYYYSTFLKRINLDQLRKDDLSTGNGFKIEKSKGLKKDVKLQNGIFSYLYGSMLSDADAFTGTYRCRCGSTRGSVMLGSICPHCGERVLYIDEDLTKRGWLIINEPNCVIHPSMYWTIGSFIGERRLDGILNSNINIDKNGIEMPVVSKPDEPFKGIGMLEFRERFDEIMGFYLKKYPHKKVYYDDIMENKNIVFTHSICVFSSILRPSRIENDVMKYENCNDEYFMMNIQIDRLNAHSLYINKRNKIKLKLMYNIQKNINALYLKIKEILAKKKGDIRSAIGGRYCFSSRSIIKQDTDLRANEVRLPFAGLCELLQQVIINILVKTYGFLYSEAYKKWLKCQLSGYDQVIYDIIDNYIKCNDGLPVLINRNPTINYGGILSCKVIGINMDYTMSISLLILKALAADFDGDTLNILYLYNQEFIKTADEVLSPVQMFISRNDGQCNADFIHARDTIINANALKSLHEYTPEQIEKIKFAQSIK